MPTTRLRKRESASLSLFPTSAIANGDQNVLTAALKSGKVQVKKQK